MNTSDIRQALGGLGRLAALGAVLLQLAACGQEPKTGPVEIKWDRDTCTRCGMAISDRRFATEVRGGPQHKAFKFDDIGCAVFWLKGQPWAEDRTTEVWVADARDTKWLDARSAHYRDAKMTPMGYGYGAVADNPPGSVDFVQLRKQILALGK